MQWPALRSLNMTRRHFERCARSALVGAVLACSDASTSPPPPPPPPPPIALVAFFQPAQAEPGGTDTLFIELARSVDPLPLRVVVVFSGIAQGADSTIVPGDVSELFASFVVPHPVSDGDLVATVSLPDSRASTTATLRVQDLDAPYVEGVLSQFGSPRMPGMPPGDFLLRAGSTLQVQVEGVDNNAVAWLGYAVGDPLNVRDSAEVFPVSASATRTLSLQVPADAAGTMTTVRVFARDLGGRLTEDTLPAAPVYRVIDKPIRSVRLDGEVRDIAWDPKRNVLYLSEPGKAQVAVLSLESLSYLAPIPLSIRPAGLDLSVSGDSLLIALHGSPYLGVVNLTTYPLRVDTLRVHYTPDGSLLAGDSLAVTPFVEDVRIAADGRAIVSLANPNLGYDYKTEADHVVTIDLATGVQQVAYTGYGGPSLPIARTTDRKSVLVMNAGAEGSTSSDARRYDATTHLFSAPTGNSPYLVTALAGSVSQDGNFYLLGGTLYDANLKALVTMAPAGYQSERSAISPDGANAYFARAEYNPSDSAPDTARAYYLRYALPTGQLKEFVRTPEVGEQLFAMPDGKTLIATGLTQLMLIDLQDSTGILEARREAPSPRAEPHEIAIGRGVPRSGAETPTITTVLRQRAPTTKH